MKEQKAITLISLVVTIIILIILAGVSINIFIGDNGLLEKAKYAKEAQIIAEIQEKLELQKADLKISENASLELEQYIQKILEKDAIKGHKIELEYKSTSNIYAYILVDDKYEFLIEKEENQNIKITYNGETILVDSINLNKTETTINIGSKETLEVTLLPEKASNKSVIWESSNSEVATVENGVVTAISEGECTITAIAAHSINKTATCKVNITYATLNSVSQVGSYVKYIPNVQLYTVSSSETGYTSSQTFNTEDATNLWQILYKDSTYGIQIISTESVGTLHLGTEGDASKCRIGYNNVITTLNSMSQKYINEKYATSARSIGSNPDNPTDTITTVCTTPSNWPNGTYTGFKMLDTFCEKDLAAMNTLTDKSLISIGSNYWLASRNLSANHSGSYIYDDCGFGIRYITNTGEGPKEYYIASVTDGGGLYTGWMHTYSAGVRPVVKLLDDIKIIGGEGTKEAPYILKEMN